MSFIHTIQAELPVWQARKGGGGCDAPPPNLPKGPILPTEWVKNGVFGEGLRGLGSKGPLFGSKRSTFGDPAPPKINSGYGPDYMYVATIDLMTFRKLTMKNQVNDSANCGQFKVAQLAKSMI